jgi:hypothetical protein
MKEALVEFVKFGANRPKSSVVVFRNCVKPSIQSGLPVGTFIASFGVDYPPSAFKKQRPLIRSRNIFVR